MRGRWGFIGVGITGEGEPERLGPSGAAPGLGVSGTECGERRPLTVVPPHGLGAAAGGAAPERGGTQGMRGTQAQAAPRQPLHAGPYGT